MDTDIELSDPPSAEAVWFGKQEKKLPALLSNWIEPSGLVISLYLTNFNLFICWLDW